MFKIKMTGYNRLHSSTASMTDWCQALREVATEYGYIAKPAAVRAEYGSRAVNRSSKKALPGGMENLWDMALAINTDPRLSQGCIQIQVESSDVDSEDLLSVYPNLLMADTTFTLDANIEVNRGVIVNRTKVLLPRENIDMGAVLAGKVVGVGDAIHQIPALTRKVRALGGVSTVADVAPAVAADLGHVPVLELFDALDYGWQVGMVDHGNGTPALPEFRYTLHGGHENLTITRFI